MEPPEYMGYTVNFKAYSKSHKQKKRQQNAPENQRIFTKTQPAIIEEKVFERVTKITGKQTHPYKDRMARLIRRLA